MRLGALAVIMGLVAGACAPGGPDGADPDGALEAADTIPPPPYSEQTQPSSQPPSAGVPGAPAMMQRPATKRGVLMLEGTADSTDFRLVQTPADFPLVFSTYAPADMIAEIDSSEAGHSVEFIADFGGVRNDRAYMQVFLYPPDATLPMARSRVESLITGLNPEIDRSTPEVPYPWAAEQTSFSYPHEEQTYVGRIALAQRGNVVFHMVSQYPAEYGDGMGPRIAAILTEWRWADGTPLMP